MSASARVRVSQTCLANFNSSIFVPYNITDLPRRFGDLIKVPHFKAQGKLKSHFDFPFVNQFGVQTTSILARIECRLDQFTHCLAFTIFSRLWKRVVLAKFKRERRRPLKSALLQVSYAMVADRNTFGNGYLLQRILGMISHRSRFLLRFIYAVLQTIPENETGFIRACLRALTPRPQWLKPLGDKGSTQSDFNQPPLAGEGKIKVASDRIREIYFSSSDASHSSVVRRLKNFYSSPVGTS